MRLQPCNKDHAAFMRVTLRKIASAPRERTVARTMRADFGGLEPVDISPPQAESAQA